MVPFNPSGAGNGAHRPALVEIVALAEREPVPPSAGALNVAVEGTLLPAFAVDAAGLTEKFEAFVPPTISV